MLVLSRRYCNFSLPALQSSSLVLSRITEICLLKDTGCLSRRDLQPRRIIRDTTHHCLPTSVSNKSFLSKAGMLQITTFLAGLARGNTGVSAPWPSTAASTSWSSLSVLLTKTTTVLLLRSSQPTLQKRRKANRHSNSTCSMNTRHYGKCLAQRHREIKAPFSLIYFVLKYSS